MRRIAAIALAVVAAVFGGAVPANADAGVVVHRPWVPWPSAPLDLPAGAYCDFAVHSDPVVDQVMTKNIEEYPDGSPKRQLAKGALFLRLTNTATGASTTANASGSAVLDFFPDGSQKWHVIGPVLVGVREGASNIPRGLWTLNGVYEIDFSPTNFKTITIRVGGRHDVCADLD